MDLERIFSVCMDKKVSDSLTTGLRKRWLRTALFREHRLALKYAGMV
jgi:hypothetical protein